MAWLRKLWCRWRHTGGYVTRDAEGRLNWRCAECARWSEHAVPIDVERRVVERQIEVAKKRSERKL